MPTGRRQGREGRACLPPAVLQQQNGQNGEDVNVGSFPSAGFSGHAHIGEIPEFPWAWGNATDSSSIENLRRKLLLEQVPGLTDQAFLT